MNVDARRADPIGIFEPLAAFFVATGLASILFWTAQSVPLVRENLHGLIAVVFLYVPVLASRLSGQPFDYRSAGLRVAAPIRRSALLVLVVVALTWPIFFGCFLSFYTLVCEGGAPRWLSDWAELFAASCTGWRGLAGARAQLPADFVLLALSQLLVVAIPEELFFRGYLLERFEARWPSRRRFLGAQVGWPILLTSALFALGHVLVDFDVQRFAVFVPGLVFGWMRSRTGAIGAGAMYHALCNLFSDTLYTSFF